VTVLNSLSRLPHARFTLNDGWCDFCRLGERRPTHFARLAHRFRKLTAKDQDVSGGGRKNRCWGCTQCCPAQTHCALSRIDLPPCSKTST